MDNSFLDERFFDNSIRAYLWCVGILLAGFLFRRYGARLISRQSFRFFKQFAHNQFSEEFGELLRKPLEQLLTLMIIFFAFDRLNFPAEWELVDDSKYGVRWFIDVVFGTALLVVITRILIRCVDFFAYVISNRPDSKISPELAGFTRELIRVVLIVLAIFAGLHFIFTVNITALVASLGIGGLAVALAAQDTLANLLGSFIIYLDKPFKVGDSIELGDISGNVEHVGFRTTRIRSAEKSLLTVPNKKIIDSMLNNISQSDMRRVRFTVMLAYTTTPEQLRLVINDIKAEIQSTPHTADDCTVRFTEFDQNSLNVLVQYFVKGNAYETMIETRERLNFTIMEIVQKHGAALAHPAPAVVVNG